MQKTRVRARFRRLTQRYSFDVANPLTGRSRVRPPTRIPKTPAACVLLSLGERNEVRALEAEKFSTCIIKSILSADEIGEIAPDAFERFAGAVPGAIKHFPGTADDGIFAFARFVFDVAFASILHHLIGR
jgi:hypothetical protein